MRNRSSKRFLLPYNRFVTVTSSPVVITASELGLPNNRPSRPHALEVRFANSAPSGVRFRVYAGNDEEIYQSPALMAGQAPQVFRVTLPASTDFSLYAPAQQVMSFAGGATWAVRLIMAHKDNMA